MVNILFVCLGNICRSTMAEAVMRHKVEAAGLSDRIRVDSAGTSRYHIGEPPHPGTCRKLAEYGISHTGIFGRQITHRDMEEFSYIIAMDKENYRDCQALATPLNRAKIHFLSDFVERGTFHCGKDVPDPWYTGDFQLTYDLVDLGCQGLLEHVVQTQQSPANH